MDLVSLCCCLHIFLILMLILLSFGHERDKIKDSLAPAKHLFIRYVSCIISLGSKSSIWSWSRGRLWSRTSSLPSVTHRI